MTNEIFEAYSEENDLTYIMERIITNEGETLEVKGFYYGEPNAEGTKEFYGKTKLEIKL